MYESGQFRLCLCISTVYFGLKNGQSLQDKNIFLKDIAAFSALSASPKAPIWSLLLFYIYLHTTKLLQRYIHMHRIVV